MRQLLTPKARSLRNHPAPWPDLGAFGPRPTGGVLVGGALRDAMLGLAWTDVDWLVAHPAAAAHEVAAQLGGSPFALDAERGHWRVVAGARTVDLIELRGPVEEDLARRDFTVDAMALSELGPIDPLGGREHLRQRRLVQVAPGALEDDPLRGLRGVRLVGTTELAWDPATREAARSAVGRIRSGELGTPAPERMRVELSAILLGERPGDALADAHELSWLEVLLPELLAGDGVTQGGLHHLDVLQHQLEALQRLATGFPGAGLELRLATLLHDVGKPACRERDEAGRLTFYGHAEYGARVTEQALRRLRFERSTVAMASKLVRRHMLPLPRDEREARRFVHRRRELLPELLQLMVADREAARGRLSSRATRRAYRTALARVVSLLEAEPAPAPLLDGRSVMRLLDIGPGPRVGEALTHLAEARAVGDVRDVEEAEEALRRYAAAQGWVPDEPRA